MDRERLQHLEVVRIAAIPAADSATGKTEAGVCDNPNGVEESINT